MCAVFNLPTAFTSIMDIRSEIHFPAAGGTIRMLALFQRWLTAPSHTARNLCCGFEIEMNYTSRRGVNDVNVRYTCVLSSTPYSSPEA